MSKQFKDFWKGNITMPSGNTFGDREGFNTCKYCGGNGSYRGQPCTHCHGEGYTKKSVDHETASKVRNIYDQQGKSGAINVLIDEGYSRSEAEQELKDILNS